MKTILLLLALLVSISAHSQINISLLHQLVEDSKNEYEKQSEASSNQAKTAINEEVNRNLMGEVKYKYRTVQERFAKLNLLMEGVGLAVTADPLVRSIIDHQEQIVFYCENNPMLIPLALETEKLFLMQSNSLMNYLIGLMASVGELNQMKVSERRLLLQHVLQELRSINRLSKATTQCLEVLIRRKSGGSHYPPNQWEASGTVDEIFATIQIVKK